MTRGVYKAVAALVATTVLAACAGGGSDAADDGGDGSSGAAGDEAQSGDEPARPEPEAFEGDAFYEVPDPLPEGTHGDLIRYEVIDEGATDGLTLYRVMYLSESLPGDPIAVTGTVSVPEDAAPEGGRDLVSIAHGTTGIADECAPSKAEDGGDFLGDLVTDTGYVIASTDYEGLGTPGRHPYLVGESEGRSVLDIARAAGQLPDAELSDRIAIAGYSQGGHGALFAGELAAEWTPELELVGTFAGAPPSELGAIMAVAGSLPVAGFLYMIVAGFEAAYPDEADPSLLLTPAGLEALEAVDEGCTSEVMTAVGDEPADKLLKPDLGSVEPWATLADENDPGRVTSDSPILILHSAEDDVVPATLSEAAFNRMCELDQDVERRVYEDGGGHGDAAPQAFIDGFAWIADRFAGEATTPNCP
ncbi:MAG TPA: lipase family protein [Acidimicrobiales bacterium]